MSARLLAPVLATLLPLGVLLAPHLVPATPTTVASDFRGGDYLVDPGHSMVIFSIEHLGVARFYGRFNQVDGRFTVDTDDPGKSSVSVRIDPKSVDTNSKDRDAHVRNADFLDVETHGELGFESTSVKAVGEDELEVVGQLTMHGVSREVTATVDLVGSGDTVFGPRAGVEARFSVNRSDFGMDVMLDKLGAQIDLIVSLEGVLRK